MAQEQRLFEMEREAVREAVVARLQKQFAPDVLASERVTPTTGGGPPPPIFRPLTPKQQRLVRLLHRQVIIIDGNIASGKSSLVDAFEDYFRTQLGLRNTRTAPEDMRALFLSYFIDDPDTRAFALQMTMKVKRKKQQLHNHLMCTYEDVTLISDRSEPGDGSFALLHYRDGRLTNEEYGIYLDEGRDEHYKTPLVAVYLRPSITTLKERIVKRNRPKEVEFYLHTDPEYLARLDAAYEEMMTPERLGCPVVCVPYDDKPLNTATVEEILDRILLVCDA